MRVANFHIEAKFAARNASEIEQIVDQSCLQFHVALDELDILHELLRKFLSVLFHVTHCRQGWGQRRAQFVAQRREKVILGPARFQRCNFLRFRFPAADLVGDVARDLGITSDIAPSVAQYGYDNLGLES